jgi:branched-chain amino acid transport system substrate-binding protein
MTEGSETPKTKSSISRRDFLRVAGSAGAAGLVVGGGAGYLLAPKGQTGGTTAITGETIRIGSTYPLTGYAAGDGQEMQRGSTMAVEEINANGGILGRQLEHIIIDAEDMAPEKIISAFERLINQEKVHAIINGFILGTGPEYDLVSQTPTIYMHANTYQANADMVKQNYEKYRMTFHCDPTERWYALGFPKIMQQLIDSGKWTPLNKNVAVLTSDIPYSSNIAKWFSEEVVKYGWTVSISEQVTLPTVEWGPILSKIRENPPGLIFQAHYAPADLASFTKQFRENPTPSLLYEQYGPSIPEYLDLAGDAANGVIWSTVIGPLADSVAQTYRAKYQQRWNSEAGWSQNGIQYDLFRLYANAVALAGDPADIQKVATNIEQGIYRGVCGGYSFIKEDHTVPCYPAATQDPSLGNPHLHFQIQNNQHTLIFPPPYAVGEFQTPPWLT